MSNHLTLLHLRWTAINFSFGWKVLVFLRECSIKVLTFWSGLHCHWGSCPFLLLCHAASSRGPGGVPLPPFSSALREQEPFLRQSAHLHSLCHFHHHRRFISACTYEAGWANYREPALGLRTTLRHQRTSQSQSHYPPQTSGPQKRCFRGRQKISWSRISRQRTCVPNISKFGSASCFDFFVSWRGLITNPPIE